MPISLATSTGKHRLADRGADLYETPVPAVRALLRVESVPQKIWEPAAGPGAITKVLRATGRTVVATDLYDWGCENSLAGADFLRQDRAPEGTEMILTNPPFSHAAAFVRHARKLHPRVVMLLRLAFLESAARADILDDGTLAAVYVFSNRLQMMHRHGWTGNKASSAMCFAWFSWDRDHTGPAIIQRIRWEPEPNQT